MLGGEHFNEEFGFRHAFANRQVDRRIQRILGEVPHMKHAGSDVALTINSGCLQITTLEASTVVACHDMPNISFASGGDPDTLDFVAYVAKDSNHGRACYVLECGGGLAQDVITTIGQAFELRFKEYLKRAPRPATETLLENREPCGSGSSAGGGATSWTPDDPEYYNDLPGKVAPEVGPPPVPPLPNYHAPSGPVPSALAGPKKSLLASDRSQARPGPGAAPAALDLSDNLIDLNSDVPLVAKCDMASAGGGGRGGGGAGAAGGPLPPYLDHEYVNDVMGSSSDFRTTPSTKDPFDMRQFAFTLSFAFIPLLISLLLSFI
uniref:EOG090X098F n=1 Tax=Evadne anonyx TaxID=141404 RepID=A0A9N6ZFE4_9CRUS|nr:EOG090X098F [Evadne anonyx]